MARKLSKRIIPRNLSWVKLKKMEEEYYVHYKKKLGKDRFLLFLGEIVNQPGHCVLFDPDKNKHHIGYHTDNFVEMSVEEI
jgi:hypothetical protein